MSVRFSITSVGHHDLPRELASAPEAEVEAVLLRAAALLGYAASQVAIERVASVVPGSCIACTDVVASVGGTRMLIASPALY
ncbi:hypothetical protein BH11MYX4_BH11MYX4_16680 [soil metagenome]